MKTDVLIKRKALRVDKISNVTADEAAYLEKCTRPDFKGRRKSTKSCEAEWHDSK